MITIILLALAIFLLFAFIVTIIAIHRETQARTDRILSELFTQRYHNEKIIEAHKEALNETFNIVNTFLSQSVKKEEPHYDPIND